MTSPLSLQRDNWQERIARSRHGLATLCHSIADVEDSLAETLDRLAETSPERAQRLTTMATEARAYAMTERSRADQYAQ